MNRFRCTIASGGGALTLTVTCDSAFAGATITATDGTTTLTKTCPSSSPYEVVFNLPNGGTWTISSGNDSVTVHVGNSVDLHHIPTGSSATPINDIQTWLHCANIWDKSYTTISQVLADGTTVTALIASNNAVDYMARSTSWASAVCADSSAMTKIGANDYCANKLLDDSTWLNAICNSTYFESVLNVKVPTMTSDTTPSGRVLSTNTVIDNKYKYYAFDNNDNTIFGTANSTTFNIGYEFSSPVEILKFLIFQNFSSQTTASILLQYSDDGSTWTTAGNSYSYTTGNKSTYNASKYGKHKYWRTSVTMASAKEDKVKTLQFYGR